MRRSLLLAAAAGLSGFLAAHAGPASDAGAPVKEFTAVNIEYKGTKVWVPSTFIVKKGEKVRLTLINKTPSGVHGFALDEWGIKEAVNNTETDNKKVVEFTPTQTGLYRTYCHMHPAHIGGQILVIE